MPATACRPRDRESPLRVAAASDLALAFAELARNYEVETGRAVSVVYGSSAELTSQIENGAPYDLFAAADATYVDRAVRSGACDGATRATYARGRLAVWTGRNGAPITALEQLGEAPVRRVALANPEHAPYGRIAHEALERAGVWQQVSPKLVFASNVRQALQFAQSGEVEAAIVALSLLPRPPLVDGALASSGESSVFVVPETLYTPLQQVIVACGDRKMNSGGLEFLKLLASERGRAILRRYRLNVDERAARAGLP